MSTFKIIAGDFGTGTTGQILVGKLYRNSAQGLHMPSPGHLLGSRIGLGQIETLEIATEQNIKRVSGTIGWGIVGGLALGPVGALAGVVAGGRKKEITFVCQFKDGRKFLGSCNTKTFSDLQAARFAPPAAELSKSPMNVKLASAFIVVAILLVAVPLMVFLHPAKSDKAGTSQKDQLNQSAVDLVSYMLIEDIQGVVPKILPARSAAVVRAGKRRQVMPSLPLRLPLSMQALKALQRLRKQARDGCAESA